jgi:T4 RnlA family RNA ligase
MKIQMNLQKADAIFARYPAVLKRQENDGLVLFDYHYADWGMFNECPEAREFRGIVFDVSTGMIASLPFHKFFNVNENEETKEERLIFRGSASIKQDGSMTQLSSHNGRLIVASRSSLTGYVNKEVQMYLQTHPEIVEFVLQNPSHTFLFEYLDPQAPIVLRPTHKELVFLNARDKFTGVYEFRRFFHEVPARVTPVRELDPTLWRDYFKPYLENVENEEGFVLHLDNQGMYKVKTLWYVRSHKLVTEQSPKGYVQQWSEGTLDDSLSSLAILGHNNVAAEAQAVIVQVQELLKNRLNFLLESGVQQEMTAKEVAITLRQRVSHPVDNLLFAELMSAFRAGKLHDIGEILNNVRLGLKESSGRIRTVLDSLGLR